jgi:glutamate carboxypeptidase
MTPRDRSIAAFLEARAGEQLDFLTLLCDQNSHTTHREGVNRVAEMIAGRVRAALPIERRWQEDAFGDHRLLRNCPDGPAVYLIGHLDTVFPADHPFQRCRVDGERLIGPGTGDMKGGLAVFVYALAALEAAELLDRLSLALLLNSDEEAGSITSRALFEQERRRAAICLCGECAGPAGEIVVSRNGKLGGRIDSFGSPRHVGRETHEKSSAILELAHKIVALEALNAAYPGASLNVGRIEGGLGGSTVAGHATALVDVRWEAEEQRAPLLARIHAAVAATPLAGCRSEWRLLNSRPAWPRPKVAPALVAALERAGGRIGQRIATEHRRGTSDANFFGSSGIPTLDGFGPVCAGDHTPEEFILIPSLRERTILLAVFLADLAEGPAMGSTESARAPA